MPLDCACRVGPGAASKATNKVPAYLKNFSCRTCQNPFHPKRRARAVENDYLLVSSGSTRRRLTRIRRETMRAPTPLRFPGLSCARNGLILGNKQIVDLKAIDLSRSRSGCRLTLKNGRSRHDTQKSKLLPSSHLW